MLIINFTNEPHDDNISFDDMIEILYKHFKYYSIRVFGMRVGKGDVQIKRGHFDNSIEIFLPYDGYDIAHVAELCNIIDEIYTPL